MADILPACPRCAAAEAHANRLAAALADNNARLGAVERQLRESNARLADNNARLADNNARLADNNARLGAVERQLRESNACLGAVKRQLRESAQRTHDLITNLMAALDERLRQVFNASADQVTEFKELLSSMKVTAGTTQPMDAHTVILATTERDDYAKDQLHGGTSRYIAGVTRMYQGQRSVRVTQYGLQGNCTNLRKFIRERVEPVLAERLRNDVAVLGPQHVPRFKGFYAEWHAGSVIDQPTFEALLDDAARAYYELQAAQDPETLFRRHADAVSDMINDVFEEIVALVEAMFPLHPPLLEH